MSRMSNERVFGAALSNEYQWRNLYLKEFGCCTYAPPIPKDPTTTAEGVYPLRRQVGQLGRTFSESDSDDCTDGDDEHGTSLSLLTRGTIGKDASYQSVSHLSSSNAQSRGAVGDQFFLLDLSHHSSPGQQQHQRGAAGRRANNAVNGGGRRGNRGAALRKDDFFDTNDTFSTKFFGFLWRQDDDEDDVDGGGGDPSDDDGDDNMEKDATSTSLSAASTSHRGASSTTASNSLRSVSYQQQRGGSRRSPSPQTSLLDGIVHDSLASSHRPNFSRSGLFSTMSRSELNDNPHGVHPALLRLHHETWTMLMDNRLMAWLHRQTADHYQSATQLRQRLLDVVTRGPSFLAAVGEGGGGESTAREADGLLRRGVPLSFTPTRTPEEALQSTFESFSPFFVVITPPAAVQRAKDQFQAARRAQLRSGSRPSKTAPADIVGLPLGSQYGSWREAYEHRQRWSKAPFSFFLLHDASYNYAQVTAIFVQLHLLYVHAHSHTRLCAEAKREAVPLHDSTQHLTNTRLLHRAAEQQRSLCPLMAMQETTENIILAYEQSASRATLTMLRVVLDFLTDAALDVVTAHRFLSREALLRQSSFDLPGVEVRRTRRAASPAAAASASPSSNSPVGSPPRQQQNNGSAGGEREEQERDGEGHPLMEREAGSPSQRSDAPTPPSPARPEAAPGSPTLSPPAGHTAFLEPQRVTEKDVNDLFELAYWFVDNATANAGVPVDPAQLQSAVEAGSFAFASSGGLAAVEGGEDVPPLPPTSAQLRAPPLSVAPGRYLPGKEPLYSQVESFVEALQLLEAYRKPLWMQNTAAAGRGLAAAQNKKLHAVVFQHDEMPNASTTTPAMAAAAAAAPASPMLSADSFTGLATPLVVLTTYLRLHGGQWLKQLCTRVFDTLRKQSVLLYVNTLDLDAVWARLQDQPPRERQLSGLGATPTKAGKQHPSQPQPMPPSATAASTPSVKRGQRSSGHGSTTAPITNSPAGASLSQLHALDFLTDGDATRRSYIEGQGRFETIISQDILYALTEFFEALYGRRATGRLPHGISVLLTQFVTTVHLFLLEGSGGANGGGNGGYNDMSPPGSAQGGLRGHAGGLNSNNNNRMAGGGGGGGAAGVGHAGVPSSSSRNPCEGSPARRVQDSLVLCKQRYNASLRRMQVDPAEAYRSSAAPNTTVKARGKGRQGQQKAGAASAPSSPSPSSATASVSRLIQTVEHQRLARFILFDCWILPALTNATALGYLAPDSPLHLRWNIDALARYLKILLHAPFAEQDRVCFPSVAAQAAAAGTGNKAGDGGGGGNGGAGGGGGGKHKGPSNRAARQKPAKAPEARAHPTNVLTLPPCITGIYDVATGSLVRLQTAPSTPLAPAANNNGGGKPPSRGSSISRLARPTLRSGLPSPEMLSLAGDRPSLVLSTELDDSSQLESQAGGWPRSRRSLFESLPTSTVHNNAAAAVKSGKAAGSPSQGGIKGKGTAADASAAALSTSERHFLPPVTSAGKAGKDKEKSIREDTDDDSAGVSSFMPGPRKSIMTSYASAADQSRSFVHRTRSRRQHDGASSTSVAHVDAGPSPASSPAAMSMMGPGDSVPPNAQRPYVFVNDAGWFDISSAMQYLNEQLGLTRGEPDGEDAEGGDVRFPHLPTPEERRGRGSTAAAMTTGLHPPSLDDNSFTSSAAQRAAIEELTAIQALNAFCRAAAADESENVVVSEFDVLPSMAAGCIEKIYDVVTGSHPMVERAMQSGAFHFSRVGSLARSPAALTVGHAALYSACLNGVLLHPRTAARVMRNVLENSPVFGHTLMRPVVAGTALELLSTLVARHGETPMVDANAIVPLLQMAATNAAPLAGERGNNNTGGSLQGPGDRASSPGLPPSTTGALVAARNAAVVHRWESESRRLLRQLAFLTTGYADGQRPLPLVPGIRRPVGPAHPVHMIRAGAQRIAADSGGGTIPIVFDPWWRAMVVALCVKASNMFDECGDDHAAAFLRTVHEREEVSRALNRQATTHFVATKGKETDERAAEEGETKKVSSSSRRNRDSAAAAASRRGREARRVKGSVSSNAQGRRKAGPKRASRAAPTASSPSAAGS